MAQVHQNYTFDISSSQAEQLLAIQHRAVSLLGRLRILRDGSVEVEDQWAEGALEALVSAVRAGVPNQAILEAESRSGMPWSVFIGHCLSWWEGSTQASSGGSMCMPKNLNPSPEQDGTPQVILRANDLASSSSINGHLQQKTSGLSTWTPTEKSEDSQPEMNTQLAANLDQVTRSSRARPPVPYLPFLVVLIERLGSLDLFFKGLKWNKGRRVPMIKTSVPWWPIVLGALAAIVLSGRSWWAPWPIMSIFGAGFGWLISQFLSKKEYCGGTACRQVLSKVNRICPRCGGDVVR